MNNSIIFTQGDDAVLNLTATDGNGNPIDLTGATFDTQIRSVNGVVVTFPNAQHTADPNQVTNRGKFSLTLSEADTASCGIGPNKDILTYVTISSFLVCYRGIGILLVYPATPVQ